MERDVLSSYLIGAVILGIVWITTLYGQIDTLKGENEHLGALLTEYRNALEEANSNIEQANSMIDDAQSTAWGTYHEMGEALDGLETVDTVNEVE